jgi:hypothetical protein
MADQVLDLTFRLPGNAVGWLDMISFPDEDPILFGGSIATTDGESRVDVTIEASQEQISATDSQLQRISDSEWVIVDEDGETASGYGVTNYSAVSLINDEWEMHSGTFNDPDGISVDFFGADSPVPAIVWIVGIGAAVCLIKIGVEALSAQCTSEAHATIQACANAGGLPNLVIESTYGFAFESGKFRLGCNFSCHVECKH